MEKSWCLIQNLKTHSEFWKFTQIFGVVVFTICRCVWNFTFKHYKQILKLRFSVVFEPNSKSHLSAAWCLRHNFFRLVFILNFFPGWVSISTFFLAGFQSQLFFRQVFNCNFFRQVFNWPQWCLGRSTRSLGSPGTSGEKTQSPVLRGRLTEAAKKLAARKNFIFYICFRSADQILVNLNT